MTPPPPQTPTTAEPAPGPALTPPPGYRTLVLLDRQRHRARGVAPHAARFAATLHAVYLSLPEFVAASRSLPVVFGPAGPELWQPLAVTGLDSGQNLCVDGHGDWLGEVYCPAWVRRYPFCTLRLREPDGGERVAVCVDEAGLAATPPLVLDARGDPTPHWRELQRLIEEFDTASRQTEAFCARLAELELLEPFEADVNPVRGGRKRVTGMWRVAEARLNALPDATLGALARNGYLARIHAHLMSLDLFHALMARAVRRAEAG